MLAASDVTVLGVAITATGTFLAACVAGFWQWRTNHGTQRAAEGSTMLEGWDRLVDQLQRQNDQLTLDVDKAREQSQRAFAAATEARRENRKLQRELAETKQALRALQQRAPFPWGQMNEQPGGGW